jgi:protocatechuate 3,4-dioxygenase beta subunit
MGLVERLRKTDRRGPMTSKPPPVTSPARRTAVRVLAAASAALVAREALAQPDSSAAATPACALTPGQTEGPYFVDERLERADIRTDPSDGSLREGTPLALALRISALRDAGCRPVHGVIVDVWHCDATGAYSDASDASLNTRGAKFLRGYQVTDREGRVRFMTIYPGAYRGRAVHIHFKVRTPGSAKMQFTSQLYFDDALTDRVHAAQPYTRGIRRRTRNDEDGLFRASGRSLLLDAVPATQGYVAAYEVGLRFG